MCNRCGCRNGVLQCTRLPECRGQREEGGDDNDEGRDRDRDMQDMMCDECMNMPSRPVCARDGRTFPTMCHAMRCQGLQDSEFDESGACADRVGMTYSVTLC